MKWQWPSGRYEQEKPIRLSLMDFTVLVRQHVMEVTKAKNAVQRTYEVFSDQGNIWPYECDYLLTSLHIITTAVHGLYKLFEETELLPSVIVPLCYQLVGEICATEARICKLVLLAGAFRSNCRVVSSKSVRQHYTIICDLEALLQASENIILCSQFLFDQTRFCSAVKV